MRSVISALTTCVISNFAFFALSGNVCAQQYPAKPVRILTAEAGGGGDIIARLIAQGVSNSIGQQFVVDNRPSTQSIDMVAHAQPDGYSLLMQAAAIWLIPYMRDNATWDPIKDFAPITIPDSAFNVVTVHPSLSAKSIRDLIATAKARPGVLNYGSASGGTTHLAAELFKAMAKVNIVRIPYRGNGSALNDLISGQIDVMFSVTSAALPHIKTHRLRALAITSAHRSDLAPGLPTVAETIPGYELVSIHVMMAPAGTPTAIVTKLNQEIIKAINRPEVKQKFLDSTIEVVGSTPEQVTTAMKQDMARLGKVIKDAGIREE